jgi:hypothetical protein
MRLCAAFLALCMAATPVCSARCSAQACAAQLSDDRTGDCHHSSSDSDAPGMKNGTTSFSCSAGEVVFTILRPGQDAPIKKSVSRPTESHPLLAGGFNDVDIVVAAPLRGITTSQQVHPVSASQAPLRL